jgi:hypothetical protein
VRELRRNQLSASMNLVCKLFFVEVRDANQPTSQPTFSWTSASFAIANQYDVFIGGLSA